MGTFTRFLVMAVATAAMVLAAATAAAAAPAVTVTPDSGLRDGDVVQVHGTGFTPGKSYVIVQCTQDAQGQGDCNTDDVVFTSADADGEVEDELTVRTGEIGSNGGRCDADNDCVVTVSEPTADENAERAFAVISFAAEAGSPPDQGDGSTDGGSTDGGSTDGGSTGGSGAPADEPAGNDPAEPDTGDSAPGPGNDDGAARSTSEAGDDTTESAADVGDMPNTGAPPLLAPAAAALALLGAGLRRRAGSR